MLFPQRHALSRRLKRLSRLRLGCAALFLSGREAKTTPHFLGYSVR
ncbi:exported hypothetical protein [Mesorhizobium plurifarium]|uniref:Uncharacterized protein n=1 Tax=Mesorhizobium plurifarium TaxID=69974 RepID=A0A090E8M6_MESPL|nr:exported hypothetical protein [Mesorhizobium plurifarium]